MRILVVDDEPAVRDALERALRLDAYDVRARRATATRRSTGSPPAPVDAIVLDVAMPELDGLEVCRRLRAAGDRTPVLMLTARDAVDDRVDGLDAGADDYLVKPFALRELQARLRALLRRAEEPCGAATLRFADLVLDPRAHEVCRGERAARALAHRVRAAAALFLEHPRQVLTPLADLRARLGLRLRRDLERARRLHRLPAPQDRGGRRAAAAAHRARRRLRAAGAVMALRGRLTLLAARRGRRHGRARLGRRLPRRARRAARAGRRRARPPGRPRACGPRRRPAIGAAARPGQPRRHARAAAARRRLGALRAGRSTPTGKVVRAGGDGAAGHPGHGARPRGRGRRARGASRTTARSTATTCACCTVPTPGGGAFQLGRSLAGVDRRCRACAGCCSRCASAGIALAAALGRLVRAPGHRSRSPT